MTEARFIPIQTIYRQFSEDEMRTRAADFLSEMQRRRTVRKFSARPVANAIIQDCLLAASSAPSGANLQPWRFVVVRNQEVKRQIRVAAEEEEHEFYARRATQEWLDALAPLGTDEHKSFLEIAPCLIVIFALNYSLSLDNKQTKNYYVSESVGIATGLLITALHHAGLATLTHTPSPMGFLNKILARPASERPFLLLVAGYPAEDAQVPEIRKKTLEEISIFID